MTGTNTGWLNTGSMDGANATMGGKGDGYANTGSISAMTALHELAYSGVAIGGATAGVVAQQMGGVYNFNPLSLTSGYGAALQLDSAANLQVDLKTALPTGSNTIGNVGLNSGSAVIGGVNTNADGPIGAGTAPANAFTIGGVHNTMPPSPASGQAAALQLDGSSNLQVNVNAALPTGSNTIGGVTLAASSSAGVGPFSYISLGNTAKQIGTSTMGVTIYALDISSPSGGVYIELWDAATQPSINTNPTVFYYISSSARAAAIPAVGLHFTTGCWVAATSVYGSSGSVPSFVGVNGCYK
ncbi:MAG TPA: hypothetical protein VGS41_12690 [Chthonomonadales bacterium]|nr:hypothetical protein [Chthonomonadales bacterium]